MNSVKKLFLISLNVLNLPVLLKGGYELISIIMYLEVQLNRMSFFEKSLGIYQSVLSTIFTAPQSKTLYHTKVMKTKYAYLQRLRSLFST